MEYVIVYADRAYRYKKKNCNIATNKKKSKTRVRVEHIFGFTTNSLNGIFVKSIGIVRAKVAIGLKNLTYNLFRLMQLNIELTA